MAQAVGSASPILERDAERAALEALLDGAAGAEGGLVLVEGPPGIGKTALLEAARETAAARGFRVLSATGSPLDRDFPFGLVHQLFDAVLMAAEPGRRAELLAGAAARAEHVLGSAADPELGPNPSHALLHGLYWLCANLATLEPVLLAVDDLHWADRPSLRWLEFLGRRLDGLRVAVAGGTRTGEPGADAELLSALASGPVARTLRPAPLSEPATAELVGEAVGRPVEPGFADACRQATGGNPLLLRALARAAGEQGLQGTAEEASRVEAIGSRGIADAVARRMRTLGPEAAALARAATVLGDRAAGDDLAALAELDAASAARAAQRLVEAGILEPGGTRFAHPLVRESIASGLGAHDRGRLHGLAASRLSARGARPLEVASHLLATEPAGDPAVVAALRAAAGAALSEGAPESAQAHLRRALAEPPAAAERPGLLLELGEIEAMAGDPGAAERLEEAIRAGLEGDVLARARAGLGRILLLRDPGAAVSLLEQAVSEAADPALGLRLEASLLDVSAYDAALGDRRAALLEEGRRAASPSIVRLAHLTQDAAYRSRPVAEVEALAARALAGGGLLEVLGPDSGTYHLVVLALRHAELPEHADRALSAGEAEARRRASRIGTFYLDHARGLWELMFGSVAAAEARARDALAAVEEAQLPLARAATVALLAEVLLERDAAEEAEALVAGVEVTPGIERMIAGPDLLAVRAGLRRRRGRLAEAEQDARRALEQLRARGWTAPLKARAGFELATTLGRLGRQEEALEVAAGEEAAARRAGTPGTLGIALGVRARLTGGDAGVELLEEGVALLARSSLTLDLAWARHDLGAALRRTRRPSDAREPLREALDAAGRIGAIRLAVAAHEELLASGARPRRVDLTGVGALTPAERRVAELAASGLSNRDIAESLWVTRKTVELHLSKVYGKLGIRSRGQLPAQLAG